MENSDKLTIGDIAKRFNIPEFVLDEMPECELQEWQAALLDTYIRLIKAYINDRMGAYVGENAITKEDLTVLQNSVDKSHKQRVNWRVDVKWFRHTLPKILNFFKK